MHAAESTASKPPPKPKEKVVKKAADGAAKKPAAKKTTAASKRKGTATGTLELYCCPKHRLIGPEDVRKRGYSLTSDC